MKATTENRGRVAAFFAVVAVSFVFFTLMFFRTQIIKGDAYVESQKTMRTYTVSVEGARGEILDAGGQKLVANKPVNEIVFRKGDFPDAGEDRNKLILELINLFEANGLEWNDELPVRLTAGGYAFDDERDISEEWLKSYYMLNMNDYATAENCFDGLVEKYGLENYSSEDALKIASVLCNMVKCDFSARNNYVFASDVPTNMVAMLLEKSDAFPGISVNVTSAREYADGTLAPHIIGTVGVISAEEYEKSQDELKKALAAPGLKPEEQSLLRRSAYSMESITGKSGIEQLMDGYLHGISGVKTVSIDRDGNYTETITTPPVTGNAVITTLRKDLQEVAQDALGNRIAELGGFEGLNAAGAVVVMDVNNADVLATASYPGYDLSSFYEDYDKLVKNPASPLWNRALSSTYAPGSTMKPAVAVAALEEGLINAGTSYNCEGTFEYKDMTFSCLSEHGFLNVREALCHSCNIFFYNVADRLGITKMNKYAQLFGLGSKTGIELPEAGGVLTSPLYKESIGSAWLSGDTIQAAIGQSDNLFTPIQLCNYCATIANGGTRYVPHIIKAVKTSDYSETVYQTEPEIAVQTGISQKTFDIVKSGMYDVANIGSTADAFSIVPVEVAAKTGTSQVKKKVNGEYVKGNNGFIIAFAPYDKPEIAVAVVIEDLDSGAATADVAADIFSYYFGRSYSSEAAPAANTPAP